MHVRRVFTAGEIKLYGKNDRSLRAVPLPAVALDALEALPRRIDTRLLFATERGDHVTLGNWRRRD